MTDLMREAMGGKSCVHGEPFDGKNCRRCQSAPERERALAEMRRIWAQLWQPIETAPKDGTHILVKAPRQIPTSVHWFDGAWQLSMNQMGEFSEYVWGPPTHWMPLSSEDK